MCRGRLIQYHNIYSRKTPLLLTKRFSDDAFQSVPPACFAAIFFADGQTQTGRVAAVVAVENREQLIATALGFFKYPTKRTLVRYPAWAPETLTESGFGVFFRNGLTGLAALWRQLDPAFRTTALQNEPTCFSCHSCSESVRACPLQCAGLKCSFHLGGHLAKIYLRTSSALERLSEDKFPTPEKVGKGTREPLFCQ